MASHNNYYKSSSSRNALPSIRDVLPDHFDRQESPYSFDSINRALPVTSGSSRSRGAYPSHSSSGPTLPPIHASHSQPHSYATPSSQYHHQQQSSYTNARSSSTNPNPNDPNAPYSFDVFRPTSLGLVHASSSSRSQGILRSTRVDAGKRNSGYEDEDEAGDDTTKKHACPHCGKRFGRPSSLKAHEVVHTEDKPHECPFPGCGKSFTVPSNMRRHYRSAHTNEGKGDEDAGYSSAYPSSSNNYYSSSSRR
ncbi:hypothetical protein BU17DRAFT_90842 [Hysterangium stoloniferum]|nr:hypothetical protein BU17DRAFT_90842 [Hysterangium stoloniferum]